MNKISAIRLLRLKKGLTMLDVAYHLRISTGTLHKWEIGLLTPKDEDLNRLSALYGCTINQLHGDPHAE